MFFRQERDRDFFDVCEKVRKENNRLSVSEIAKIAVFHPASSFYLTTKELAKIINNIRKGIRKSTFRSEGLMYDQIEFMMREIPGHENLPAREVARKIDAENVPRFYLSESRATSIYYECLNKRMKRA